MKYNHRPFYIFIVIILLAVLNISCYKVDSAHAAPKAKSIAPVSVPSVSVTSETIIDSVGAAHETKPAELKNNAAKKKKMPLKTVVYIFDAIISALINLLVGTGAFMIVLMILKWFFLERRVEK